MTDNTQELDEILTIFLHDCSDYEQGKPVNLDMSFTQTKKRVLDWHNKQVEAELEALREEVKHEGPRTISQVITARIDKLKEAEL